MMIDLAVVAGEIVVIQTNQRKKSRIPEPVQMAALSTDKIVLILIGIMVLTVGGYLFFAKTANVKIAGSIKGYNDYFAIRTVLKQDLYLVKKRTYVELDAISDNLENAVIATEDRSFYKNSGINYQRTILAVLTLGRSGGGSTITQQLAKNAFLTQEQTISRKG